MFADPQTVTVNLVARAMNRINQDKYAAEYRLLLSDREFRFNIRNTSYPDKKRGVTLNRHNVEIIETVFPIAPATTSYVRKAYMVVENQLGDTLTDPVKLASGLCNWLAANNDTNLTKLMNSES